MSSDKSEDEKVADDDSQTEGSKNFVVSDGHISIDEKPESDIEIDGLDKENYKVSKINNKNNFFDIMGIKEDFTKPFILHLNNSCIESNQKMAKISSMLTAVLLRNKENSNYSNFYHLHSTIIKDLPNSHKKQERT